MEGKTLCCIGLQLCACKAQFLILGMKINLPSVFGFVFLVLGNTRIPAISWELSVWESFVSCLCSSGTVYSENELLAEFWEEMEEERASEF